MKRDEIISKYRKDRSLRDDYQLDEDENYLIDEIVNALKQGQTSPIHNVRVRSINEMEYQAEQNECANMYLDDLNVPRKDASGEVYSTVGRIKHLEQNGF